MIVKNNVEKFNFQFSESVIKKSECAFTQHDRETRIYFLAINPYQFKISNSSLYYSILRMISFGWHIPPESLLEILEGSDMGASIAITVSSNKTTTYELSTAVRCGSNELTNSFICEPTHLEKKLINKYIKLIDGSYTRVRCTPIYQREVLSNEC